MAANQTRVMNEQNRFRVYSNLLKDSPYKSGEDEWLPQNEDKVINLANEIVNGNKTCYLVSGYRGVGKTSFIMQVQERTEKLVSEKKNNAQLNNTAVEEIPECLFVLTNFAKYENHKSLLRRMIRDVYQVYEKNPEQVPQNEKKKVFKEKIEDLYKRTFLDIKTQLSEVSSTEVKVTGETDLSALIKKYLPLLLQAIIAGTGSWYFVNQWIKGNSIVLSIILFIACIALLIFSIVKVTITATHTQSKATENTIEDIYDDEIADFKFHELLDSFESINYRLVFVLDELDKVSIEDLDNLIKEMKPYLLSGKAHFIIVAGQELAYRYLWAYSGDDAVIGSLFSKFYHIPLFPRDSLEEIGKRLINLNNVSPDSIANLSPLFDYLIFKCRRVPRAFVARFRQIVAWEIDENKEQVAYITIPEKQVMELQVQTLAIIKDIERLSITPKQYEPVLSDFLLTQLFINAQQMIFKKDYPQSINDYLDRYSKSDQLADKAYYQNIEEIIMDLFNRMKQENIVKERVEIKKDTKKEESTSTPKSSVSTTKEEKSDETDFVIPGETIAGDQNVVEVQKSEPVLQDAVPELIKFKREWLNFIDVLKSLWELATELLLVSLKPNPSIYDFLEDFISVKAISFIPIQSRSLVQIINNPQLLEDNTVLSGFREQLRKHSINPIAFQRQLTEFMIRQAIMRKLINQSYNERSLTGYDAAFLTQTPAPDLLIDFRHSETSESDRSDIDKMIEKLSGYNAITKKGNDIAVIETFFNPDADVDSNLLMRSFDSYLDDLNPVYRYRINYFPVLYPDNKVIKQLVSDCIGWLTSYEEFSINNKIEEKQKLIPSIVDYDYDDPQKHLWGGQPYVNGKWLEASIYPVGREQKKFVIKLTVEGSNAWPLRGFVYFLVHQSFPEQVYKVLAKNNVAYLELEGYEAFTVGAVCDDGATELELNLNDLRDAPEGFRYTVPSTVLPANPNPASKTVTSGSSRSVSVKRNFKK